MFRSESVVLDERKLRHQEIYSFKVPVRARMGTHLSRLEMAYDAVAEVDDGCVSVSDLTEQRGRFFKTISP
jgi:hypothetical protein